MIKKKPVEPPCGAPEIFKNLIHTFSSILKFDTWTAVLYHRDSWRFQLSNRRKHFMSLVKVKPKYQVLIPPEVREKANVQVGDFLEASVKGGKITLTPKTVTVVDRDIEISLQQMREGKMSPAFSSARDLINHLHRQTKKLKKKSK